MTLSLRNALRWLSSSLLLLLIATSPPAGAASSEPAAWDADWAEEDGLYAFDDDTLFVVGNTLFAVYHELGHALIDLLNLPVIGREENAVDGFAAVTMIPETPNEVRDALIVAVADGWRAVSEAAADGGERRYWGEHALDEQRHFAVVCLMVGSDQDGFYDYALEAGLPEQRIQTCADDFTAMKGGWKRLLDPHRPDVQAAAVPASPSITVIFDDPSPGQRQVHDLIRDDGLLEEAILAFADGITLPTPITIHFTTCENANAYWSRSELSVTVCYELIDEFDSILSGAVLR